MKSTCLLVLVSSLLIALPVCVYSQVLEEDFISQQMRSFNQSYLANPRVETSNVISPEFLNSMNEEKTYQDTPLEKAGQGTINMVTAWTEIPEGITAATQQYNILAGITYGLGKGVASGVLREASGVYDMATCGVPPYDKPSEKPKYQVNNPQKDGLKIAVFSW